MLLSEPPATQYDLRFSIFGIPVRVHPFFWLITIVLGWSSRQMIDVVIWVGAVFVSILVHELGHALMMRRFGLRSWITLYGMGGLAGYDPAQLAYSKANTWIRQILISLAGPGSGFLLGAAVACIIAASGQSVPSYFRAFFGEPLIISDTASRTLTLFAYDLLWVSVIWGLVNLLPIYPLDGGQISREISLRFNPREGIRRSLILSIAAAGLLAALALANMLRNAQNLRAEGLPDGETIRDPSLFVAILFGYLAYSSYVTLQAYLGGRSRW